MQFCKNFIFFPTMCRRVAREGQRGHQLSKDAKNYTLTKKCAKFLHFYCAEPPAREAYSGHSGVKIAPRGMYPSRQIPDNAYATMTYRQKIHPMSYTHFTAVRRPVSEEIADSSVYSRHLWGENFPPPQKKKLKFPPKKIPTEYCNLIQSR